jgi:DNA-directed RNA polymerase alpha subunit
VSTSSDNILLLDQPAESLPVSEEFLKMMHSLQFHTLRELLQHPAHELLEMDGFGYRMLRELLTLLENHNLADKLQE